MSDVVSGMLAGVVFGLLAVAVMLPLPFPDKRAALLGAFLNRFAIGFLIPLTTLPVDAWLRGLLVGLLISLPDAIITKAYLPIVVIGGLGGAIIGWLVG
jgi:hypothetical protein